MRTPRSRATVLRSRPASKSSMREMSLKTTTAMAVTAKSQSPPAFDLSVMPPSPTSTRKAASA